MKYFFSLLLIFTCNIIAFGQSNLSMDSTLVADTIESESTDSTIVYIVKKPPVIIKQEIEIQQTKKNNFYYISLSINCFNYFEKYKATSTFNTYTETLKEATSPHFSYSISGKISKMKNKIALGLSLGTKKIFQDFKYTDSNGIGYSNRNSFSYVYSGFSIGRWIKPTHPISYIPQIEFALNYFHSSNGFTLNKQDYLRAQRIKINSAFAKYLVEITLSNRFMIMVKKSFLELEPFFTFTPFSVTQKTEVFSLVRYQFGLKLSYTLHPNHLNL